MAGTIIQAASRFGGTMTEDEKQRRVAESIERAAGLVEAMLKDRIPPEDFPDHIRALSPYAERD